MCVAGQQGQDVCQVFVADEPDHAVKLLVGRRFELFGHVGDAVGVVPRVAYDERIFTQLLPASRQRGDGRRIARPFEEGTAGDRQRGLLVQEIDRRRGRQDIMALVIARKVEVYLEFAVVAHAVHAEVLPPFPATALLAREYLFGIDDFRFVGRSDLLEHFVVAHIALADHDRDALLDDSGFFGCDLLERVAQQRRMLQPDVGDDAYDRYDDIRGVESSAQSRFDHRDLDVALCEVVESQCRGHFEERQFQLDHLVVVFVHEVHDLLFGNHLAVDADAFGEILQVGRGEKPRAVAGLLQYRGDDMRYGTFAVRARHVDREEIALGVADVAAECGDALQSRLVGRCAFGFEGRQRLEEEFEGLGVIHIGFRVLFYEVVLFLGPVGDVVEHTEQHQVF